MATKFFRVCKEGPTIDGRTITAEMIQQAAETYNPKHYGARTWIEHFRSLMPGGVFSATGDVAAVKAEKDDDGKWVLLASVEPTERMTALAKAKDKIFWSAELFMDEVLKKWYLFGLAHTDSPASFGTEAIKLNAQRFKDQSDQLPYFGELIEDSTANEAFAVTPDTTHDDDAEPSLAEKVKHAFSSVISKNKQVQGLGEGIEALSVEIAKQLEPLATLPTAEQFSGLQTTIEALSGRVESLETLAKTPSEQFTPPPNMGGTSATQTDC